MGFFKKAFHKIKHAAHSVTHGIGKVGKSVFKAAGSVVKFAANTIKDITDRATNPLGNIMPVLLVGLGALVLLPPILNSSAAQAAAKRI